MVDVMDPDNFTKMWKDLWSKNDIAWHLSTRNPSLVKYDHHLLENQPHPIFLFPLCGKVIDMKYYWEQGYEVFGIDCSSDAILQFFTENKIEYKIKNISDKLIMYSSLDERLHLINANIFTCDNPIIRGKINCVWDRGAFGTLTEIEQTLYIKSMKRLLAPDFKYLLLVTEFDQDKFNGVPYSQPETKVRAYFEDFCNVEKLNSRIPDHLSLYQKHMNSSLELKETTYLMTPKRSSKD